jgi:hypothetical protein
VFVGVDITTRLVFRGVESRLLGRADRAVVQVAGFQLVDVLLFAFELTRFAGAQLTRLQALLDALLLIDITLLVLLDRLSERSRAQKSGCNDSKTCCC